MSGWSLTDEVELQAEKKGCGIKNCRVKKAPYQGMYLKLHPISFVSPTLT